MQLSAHTELSNLQPATLDAGLVFSGKSSGRMIQGYASPTAYTPQVNPEYIFHESSRDIIVWLMSQADPLYVYGPVGCGKSTAIKQLAARLHYPVFEVTGHGRLEFADLIGHLTIKDNNMSYEYGPLALAMRYGGILLLNEADLISPEVAAGLNTILDGSPLCIAENGGELITPHPMYRFVATANTNGSGDETGLYQGAQRQHLAWLDRFIVCEMSYPSPEVEKNLLGRHFPALPEEITSKMVDFANEIRKLFMGESTNLAGAIEITLSTRTLLRWADLTLRFQPLASQGIQPIGYALDRALGFRAGRETRAMLHELAQRIFPAAQVCYTIPATDQSELVWLQTNLQPLLGKTLRTYPSIYLRKDNASGGKFWICEASATGLTVRWGKLKTVGQSLHFEANKCADTDPIQELLNRASTKIKRGYTVNHHLTSIPKE